MSNLSANSVEQAQETCLYLENPNIDNALNNTLEDMKTEMTENEGVQNPLNNISNQRNIFLSLRIIFRKCCDAYIIHHWIMEFSSWTWIAHPGDCKY